MSEIKVLQGEAFTDHRGVINSLNNFRFDGVERTYFIYHPDSTVIRGWHGHKFEKKWYYCVKGSFVIAMVRPDDWEAPSADLVPEFFQLSQNDSKIVCVPEGYTNCIKAKEDDSILLVLSGKVYEEALLDSWRYDSSMWVDDWSKY